MIVNYKNKEKVYNDITKSTWYAKNKENLNKTKYLEIDSFSVIIDWINSLLISKNILNAYNIYEEIKDGVIILKLIKIYKPEIELRGIFLKAIKKKCAIKNLEKALSIIYMNNPYYYSLVSSRDIYEKKKKKVNILLIQLFDKFEFQNLKNISTPLLNWYNYTLIKMKLPLYSKTINNPFHIINNKPINCCDGKGFGSGIQKDNIEKEIIVGGNMKKNMSYNFIKKCKIKNKSNALTNFITYILYKDKEECQNDISYIVKDFSDCIKIFFILYRYGYICIEELQIVTKSNKRNNFFFLHELLRKLNIPIVLKNQYLNNPSEVAILLQLKYIQCFIHNNGYSKAIDLKKYYFPFVGLDKKCANTTTKCSDNGSLNGYTKHNYNRTCEQKDNQFLNAKLHVHDEKEINDNKIEYSTDDKNNVYEKVEYKTCKDIPNLEADKMDKNYNSKDWDGKREEINQVNCYNLLNNKIFNSSVKICQSKERTYPLQGKKEKKIYAHQNEKDNHISINKYLEKDLLTITPIKMLRKMFHQEIKENMNIHKADIMKI
ncbi:conserved Plasmodium protein, unknown function [Plasmodium vinckei vinckei]|uniref:Calponin-homology (CH) domain-containing protein n=1 Tax=Plasmodium vinckei vinckei TaxID=54757 RepID=A0A449BWY8_PLAVN|nr:conserved Plasmodium protein, unknown function [Plasmodium vinckei vinckei]VEV57859.1 conserved Plasmodium protein, unknown function [Plasmodium vinckei vinckei]